MTLAIFVINSWFLNGYASNTYVSSVSTISSIPIKSVMPGVYTHLSHKKIGPVFDKFKNLIASLWSYKHIALFFGFLFINDNKKLCAKKQKTLNFIFVI